MCFSEFCDFENRSIITEDDEQKSTEFVVSMYNDTKKVHADEMSQQTPFTIHCSCRLNPLNQTSGINMRNRRKRHFIEVKALQKKKKRNR